MVPSQIVAVLDSPAFAPARLASLQMLQSVGAPLHLEHKQRLNAAFRREKLDPVGPDKKPAPPPPKPANPTQ